MAFLDVRSNHGVYAPRFGAKNKIKSVVGLDAWNGNLKFRNPISGWMGTFRHGDTEDPIL